MSFQAPAPYTKSNSQYLSRCQNINTTKVFMRSVWGCVPEVTIPFDASCLKITR